MKKKVIDWLGVVFIALSLLFIVRRVIVMEVDLSRLFTPINLAMIIIMPFTYVTTVFSNAYCWKMVLSLFTHRRIPAGDAFEAYAKSNVMKYLPGNVGHYAGRQFFGARMGVSQLHLATTSVLEVGYSTLALVICALMFSADLFFRELQQRLRGNTLIWLAAVIGCGAVAAVAIAVVFRKNRYVSAVLALLRRPRFWVVMAAVILLASFISVILALQFVVILGQYAELSLQTMCIITAANCAAFFIGFITPGAPGGIGVREAVLLAMLSPYFPAEGILFAAVVQRLISIIGDVIAVPVSRLLAGEQAAPEQASQQPEQ